MNHYYECKNRTDSNFDDAFCSHSCKLMLIPKGWVVVCDDCILASTC